MPKPEKRPAKTPAIKRSCSKFNWFIIGMCNQNDKKKDKQSVPQMVKASSRLPIKRYPIIIKGIFRSNVDRPGLIWNQYLSKSAIPLIPPSASLLGMLMASKLKA